MIEDYHFATELQKVPTFDVMRDVCEKHKDRAAGIEALKDCYNKHFGRLHSSLLT
jgi:hypothetical protein